MDFRRANGRRRSCVTGCQSVGFKGLCLEPMPQACTFKAQITQTLTLNRKLNPPGTLKPGLQTPEVQTPRHQRRRTPKIGSQAHSFLTVWCLELQEPEAPEIENTWSPKLETLFMAAVSACKRLRLRVEVRIMRGWEFRL